MDPEQTFIRVQERFSKMLTLKIRVALEYFFLFLAITLFCILIVMHANYVQQPGCSSELSDIKLSEAQLIQIKIASAGLWSHDESMYEVTSIPQAEFNSEMQNPTKVDRDGQSWLSWISSDIKVGKTLSPRRWNAAFSQDGHLDIAGVLRRIQRGGIHPLIKGEVWEFLLGCFDPNSSLDDRNVVRQQRRWRHTSNN